MLIQKDRRMVAAAASPLLQVLGLKGIYPPAGQQGICLGSVGVPASAAIPTQRRHPRSAGLDMLHRLGMHNDVVEVLLAEGKVRAERHTLG